MRKFIFIIIVFFCQSCLNTESSVSYTLLIKSPYKCTHKIDIDKNGYITCKVGLVQSNIENFTDFEDVFEIKQKKKLDSNYFSQLKNLFKKTKKYNGPFVKDAFHYQFYANDTLLVDGYDGQLSEIKEIRDIISKVYSNEIDFFCDSYY